MYIWVCMNEEAATQTPVVRYMIRKKANKRKTHTYKFYLHQICIIK